MYVEDSLQVKSDIADSDAAVGERVLEESLSDEGNLAVDAPKLKIISKQSQAAAVSALPAKDAEAPTVTDADIEKLLLSIIKLKQSGDETWISQLNSFRQTHPDYPLPDELLD